MLALRFYDVVLSLHVAAIVVAFGVVFTYPLVLPWLRRHHPGAMVVAHETQARVGRSVITPAATIALLAGVYLATDAELWGELWVVVPFAILVAILGLGGAVLAPTERPLAELASDGMDTPELRRHVQQGDDALERRRRLVLVAIFFMVPKLGA
jgi:hypothetical protein